MTPLQPIQRRIVALAILALVVTLVVAVVALPVWLLNRRYEVAMEDAVTRLQRYSRLAGMRDGLLKKAMEVKVLELNHHFLKSASPALAAAELQEQAKTILDQAGAKLNSIQIMPHKDDGMYRQVSVALQLTAPLSSVKTMFHALESARPYLFIGNLSVRTTNFLAARNDAQNEPDLVVQFDLTGYALKGGQ